MYRTDYFWIGIAYAFTSLTLYFQLKTWSSRTLSYSAAAGFARTRWTAAPVSFISDSQLELLKVRRTSSFDWLR